MKLGEGGEAFFVFEAFGQVPEEAQTSPLISPASSPPSRPSSFSSTTDLEPLDLNSSTGRPESWDGRRPSAGNHIAMLSVGRRAQSELGSIPQVSRSLPEDHDSSLLSQSFSEPTSAAPSSSLDMPARTSHVRSSTVGAPFPPERSRSPPALPRHEAVSRAKSLSEKLRNSNIASTVNEEGDIMLDTTGYKSSEEESLRAEIVARQILSEEIEGHYDIGSLIGADDKGNLWIYSSEEAKEAASRRALFTGINPIAGVSTDTISDPGYHSSEDTISHKPFTENRLRRESDSALGLSTPPDSPDSSSGAPYQPEPSRSYVKTLRLTSDQLKSLHLRPGVNPISFSVNRAVCSANMYLWRHDAQIVVSDVDGTITKSDALGHVLNMIGRDWTHLGVAKLFTDIVANGYNIVYLTSRSVGQADSTRTYLRGISQDGGYKLPPGPVIMSPDRTIAALRREIYLRKPEIFKIACLRDIKSLFGLRETPFYAGFGNRVTDAMSYRSVNIPATRIFTINSNAEVSLFLETLKMYRTGYATMREAVDHYFPPTSMLVQEGGENYTQFNYWREKPRDEDEFSLTDSDSSGPARRPSVISNDDDDDASGDEDGMQDSIMSRESVDAGSSVLGSPNGQLSPVLTRQSIDNSVLTGRASIESAMRLQEEPEDMDELEIVAEAAGRIKRKQKVSKG